MPVWYIVFQVRWRKLKRKSINREWVINSCNDCVLYYLNFRNFNFKIVWKLREKFFAHKLQRRWGNGIYSDLETKSCSKENIAVPSFLTLHTTPTTKETFPLIFKKKQYIPQKITLNYTLQRHSNLMITVCIVSHTIHISITHTI